MVAESSSRSMRQDKWTKRDDETNSRFSQFRHRAYKLFAVFASSVSQLLSLMSWCLQSFVDKLGVVVLHEIRTYQCPYCYKHFDRLTRYHMKTPPHARRYHPSDGPSLQTRHTCMVSAKVCWMLQHDSMQLLNTQNEKGNEQSGHHIWGQILEDIPRPARRG